MSTLSRRGFLRTTALTGVGFWVATGGEKALSRSPNERPAVACIGVAGKGGGDINNASKFGNIVALCDIDKGKLGAKSKQFPKAKTYVDFREMFKEQGQDIEIVTVSTPDHMHACQTLMAMRMGKHVYTQKPLTRTIYEARLLAKVAKETGVCTQMGNQGTALDSSRMAVAQIKAGVLGTVKEIHVWSNRPFWAQGPNRRMDMEEYARQAKAADPENADLLINAKKTEMQRLASEIDWNLWLGIAPKREFWPGIYHSFAWRGWWDFGSGALGDMACHQVTVPFASCDLKNPIRVTAKTTGHDFDSFPASSTIRFDFPKTESRPEITFMWYDRKGNKPPKEVFEPWGIEAVSDSGILIVGEKGALYSTDDYCGKYELKGVEPLPDVHVKYAKNVGNNNANHMNELFRAVDKNKPSLCVSNFVDRGGPLTETILLGNLAVWAASQGGENGQMGDWGESIEWDAENLEVTNLADLKTPRIRNLIKPDYNKGYRLD